MQVNDGLPHEIAVVLTTAPSAEAATRLARTLLAERRIACANLLPGVQSLYWWNEEMQADAEVLLLLKAPADSVPALAERIRALHPYELPEVVALPVRWGDRAYTEWVHAETAGRTS